MKIKILLEEEYEEICVEIKSNKIDSQVKYIYNLLTQHNHKVEKLIGSIEDTKYFLNLDSIVSIYSQDKKNYAKTKEHKDYLIKEKLYELEELLFSKAFLRISNSEIINTNEIEKLDYSFKGCLKLITKTGHSSYVSRRYLKSFKAYFNL